MKKFVTLFAAVAMLLSLLVIGVSAEQTNQEIIVPRFAAQPTFDGFISVEEWGEPTIHVVTDGAATVDDDSVGENEEFGLRNHFYWFSYEDADMSENFYYDAWYRWDDKYLYVAAKVNDPDPFSQPGGGGSTWNGDSFQFIVDVKGVSVNMLKQEPEFNYKTDPFLGARFNTPWSSKNVFKSAFGLVKGKTPVAWRADGDWDMVKEGGVIFAASTKDNGDGMTCTNIFEIAVPWSVIAAEGTGADKLNTEFVPKAGDAYGTAIAVCCSDSNTLNAWLQWGQGVCSVSDKSSQPRETRGGAQAMVLSADEFTPAAGYETVVETTENPEETEKMTVPPAPVVSTTKGDAGDEPADSNNAGNNNNKPSTSSEDEGGLPTGAIVGIVAGVVVVAAVVVVIIKKKK